MIIRSDTGQYPNTALLMFLFMMNPTPLVWLSPPEYSIVCCSFCILPDPVHLISDKPRISIFMYVASLIALSNFPVAYKLLTFQVPILRGCLLVFKHPTSVCSVRDRFELHPSLRSMSDSKAASSSLSLWVEASAGGSLSSTTSIPFSFPSMVSYDYGNFKVVRPQSLPPVFCQGFLL